MGDSLITVKFRVVDTDTEDQITIPSNIEIGELKSKVAPLFNRETDSFRLIFRGKVLKEGTTLNEYDVQDGYTVQLVPIIVQEHSDLELTEPTPPPRPQRRQQRIQLQFNVPGAVRRQQDQGPPPELIHNNAAIDAASKIQLILADMQEKVGQFLLAAYGDNNEEATNRGHEMTHCILSRSQECQRILTTSPIVHGSHVQQVQIGNMGNIMGHITGMVTNLLGGGQQQQNQPPQPSTQPPQPPSQPPM